MNIPHVDRHPWPWNVLQSELGTFHIHTLPSAVPARSTFASLCHSSHWKFTSRQLLEKQLQRNSHSGWNDKKMWMNQLIDARKDGQMGRWVDISKDGQMNRQMNRQTDAWIERKLTEVQTDRDRQPGWLTDRWTGDRQTDKQTKRQTDRLTDWMFTKMPACPDS